MRRVFLLLALALVPVAAALPSDPTDPLSQNKTSPFHDGLVWSVGLGSVGVATVLGVLYYLGIGGLRHVDRDNVLNHPMRKELLQTIATAPGIHLRELASRHDTAVTNTQWHLRKLEMAGLVKTQKMQGRRLYYPVQGGQETKTRALENAALHNPNAEKVSEFLASHGGSNQRTVADALAMNPGTVRWHLRKLESAGIVKAIQEGAQTRYFVMRAVVRTVPRETRVTEQPLLVQ